MTDARRHRGRHPRDEALFGPEQLPRLRAAVADLSWLLGRGYALPSSLALVGNRYDLRERQRLAVGRCAATDEEVAARRARAVQPAELTGRTVAIDGFNCIIALEAALSGGVVLVGRDGALRDLSSVHGSYRTVEETRDAVNIIFETLVRAGAITWLLDRPVSNSGRLKTLIGEIADARQVRCEIEVVYDPDRVLAGGDWVVASGDAWILDHCAAWVDVPGVAIAAGLPGQPRVWLVDLR